MTEQAQSNGKGMNLYHNIIRLPEGKSAGDVVGERHDIVLLTEVVKSNPNGDPDTGNMPRLQPDTMKGLMTDVCQKRKIRNFYSLYMPSGALLDHPENGYQIFIRENAVLQDLMENTELAGTAKQIFDSYLEPNKGNWVQPARGRAGSSEFIIRAYRDALCQTFFDVRAFGGVVSTEGPLKGSFYGQIRGPIQFGFAESLDRVLQLDFTITRCASASEKEANQAGEGEGESESSGNRTMGRKHVVDYGIYRSHIYFSPAFAAKTGYTYYDLDNFLFALQHMFTDDRAAARPGGMRVVGLVDFQHSTPLGNEHAHKLFEMVKVHRADVGEDGKIEKEFPQSIADYCGEAPDGAVREKDQGGPGNELITARRIIWEIPACHGEKCTVRS
jgi:CRISPR-associated protein Csd2